MQHADAAIAGAGIIGLSAALELASAGLRVVVFERGQAMRECSWAAAGMLAGTDPENSADLRTLSHLSLSLYPEFREKIEHLSGKSIPIRTTQTLQGARALPAGAKRLGVEDIQILAPGFNLRGCERHGLEPCNLSFFLLQEESLDPRDLARALPAAVKAAGVTLIEQTTVAAITTQNTQNESVRIKTSAGECDAAHFVNACGAWASDLAAVPIVPRRGQMLLVESSEPLSIAIRTPELYLLPRGDGRIVIGATVEDAGYDKRVDSGAIAALHNAAAELWPPIRGARIVDAWAGLRPAATDSLPVIGPWETDADNAGCRPHSWLAVGHFRNGILLAPGTAQLVRQMILREPLGIDTTAFNARRFAESFAR